jgi:cell division protein FtsB
MEVFPICERYRPTTPEPVQRKRKRSALEAEIEQLKAENEQLKAKNKRLKSKNKGLKFKLRKIRNLGDELNYELLN